MNAWVADKIALTSMHIPAIVQLLSLEIYPYKKCTVGFL